MAEIITIPDLENGKVDVGTLADIVNLQEPTTETRLSGPVNTWFGVQSQLSSATGLVYETKAQMDAAPGTVPGQASRVVGDGANDGFYVWSGSAWVKTTDPLADLSARRRKFYAQRQAAIDDIPNLDIDIDEFIVVREGTLEITRWLVESTNDPLIPADGETPAKWGILYSIDTALGNVVNALDGEVSNIRAMVGQYIGNSGIQVGTSTANLANIFAFETPVENDGYLRRLTFDAKNAGLFRIYALTRTGTVDPCLLNRWVDISVTQVGVVNVDVSLPVFAGELIGLSGNGISGVGYSSEPGVLWYGINRDTLISNAGQANFKMQMRFEIDKNPSDSAPVGVHDNSVIDVRPIFTGLSSTTSVRLGDISGGHYSIGSTLTHTAAPAGERRYDLIMLNRLTNALEISQGTASALECEEHQPVPTSVQTPVARVLVNETTIVSIDPIGQVLMGVPAVVQASIDNQIDAIKRGCGRFMAKVRSGAPVRIGVIGDSIQNIRGAQLGETTQINGVNRDAGTQASGYFDSNSYSAEFKESIPLYTSTELGRGDDGGGAIHTRVGMIWELVAALESQGRVLGTDLFYDNAAIGGSSSTGAWNDTTDAPTAWLTLFGGVGADLAIIAWGMNERGSATTEARLIKIAQYLKGLGSDVLFMEVPRPKTPATAVGVAQWRYTNAAIRRAAAYIGTGAVPLSAIGEDGMHGYLGVNADDICAANNTNHPGPLELTAYGRLLARVVE